MQVYLVGGAVRDQLLQRQVTEKDWVVVGATPQELLDKGYQQVGKDFPVFLHPDSKEEYALARTERKSGVGYTGFECDSSETVTLEQDLVRRDLTVNAMAMDTNGDIIDPYGGQQDLHDKVLRHVSDAFVEDPLRVLRVARFAARYAPYGFSIHADTLELMTEITKRGELTHLSAERVWKETSRSLMEGNPEVYFETLKSCGALAVWFEELDRLWGVPNPVKWHPEIDTGVHTMMVLQKAVAMSDKLEVRFSALVHDLGKAMTPPEKWPSHHGHEKLGLSAIENLCNRLKVPNQCKDLAKLVSEFHSHVHRAFDLKSSTILKVLNHCDAWRKPERYEDMLVTCHADALGRKHFEDAPYPQANYMRDVLTAANSVDVQSIISAGHTGKHIKEVLDQRRCEKIEGVKQHYV